MTRLIEPHGGTLKVGYVDADTAPTLTAEAGDLPEWNLTHRQLCDVELLLNGGFSPLEGFLTQADYDSVCANMRLTDGTLWPMPITLDVSREFAERLAGASTDQPARIGLRDAEYCLVGVMEVTDIWEPDKSREAESVFGSDDTAHPGVAYLHHQAGDVYLGGRVLGLTPPTYYDFKHLRNSPQQLRDFFEKVGWTRIVAFQTRNPMHRAHQELTFRAAKEAEANLLIHPVVGMTKPGDIDHFTRVRCYEYLIKRYPEQTTTLSLLPLAMRMGGPREAVWHALIRKNYGCTHFIVGRDHAGPGKNSAGEDFYGPYDAQELMQSLESELGIVMVPFKEMVYVEDRGQYVPRSEIGEGENVLAISGTEVRRRLEEGIDIPDWFSYPEVVTELRRSRPPKSEQGFTCLLTGLSGAGKSTIAHALLNKLMELGGRPVTLLDGDVVRKHLSSELGFSKEHREINVKRIGFVASEITKNGGIAICAPIAPYANTRRAVREMVEQYGGFIEVHVATPLATCEERDRKGLYALARAGKVQHFTGISDPYEVPEKPDLSLNTEDLSPDEAAHQIVLKLEKLGYIK